MFEHLPLFKEICHKCFALPICGGGCLVQGNKIFKSKEYFDSGYCEYAKNIMEWILARVLSSAS